MDTSNCKGPITFQGGKSNMIPYILDILPPDIKHYCEPYAGGAWLFFSLPVMPGKCSLNDLNKHLMLFYRAASTQGKELQEMIERTLYSEAEWQRAREIVRGPADESRALEIGWAVHVLYNQSFMGKGTSWGYCKDTGDKWPPQNWKSQKYRLSEACRRLENCQLFCRDGLELMKALDGPDIFFYQDPHYLETTAGRYAGKTTADYLRKLLEFNAGMKGRFLFSHYENEEIKAAIEKNGWRFKVIPTHSKVQLKGKAHVRRQEEWLIWNYEEPQRRLFE